MQSVKHEIGEHIFYQTKSKEAGVKSSARSQGTRTVETRVENRGQEIKWEVISRKKNQEKV